MKSKYIFLLSFLLISFSVFAEESPKSNSGISCDPKQPCWICTPSLRDKGRLWCKEHDRYEDRCWLCHPEMQDKGRLYCKEHGVYEDECSLCHPEIVKKNITKKKSDAKCQHKVEKTECLICTPSNRTKGRLWCKEHNRYENRCWLCHPELKEENRTYCKEHFLYEDECYFCSPNLNKNHQSHNSSDRLHCREHDVFEDECAICHPELASELSTGSGMKIRFISKDSATKAGVSTSNPGPLSGVDAIEAYTEVSYNKNKLVHITPLIKGVVNRVLVNLGDEIKKGDPLVEISSTDVALAKQIYIEAILNEKLSKEEYHRQQTLRNDGISSQKILREIESTYERSKLKTLASYQSLLNLGLTQSEIEHVVKKSSTDAIIILKAPFDGTVVDRSVVLGQAVNQSSQLLKIASLKQMWLDLSMSTRDLMLIKKGQKLTASFPELPHVAFDGVITWIDTRIDPRSRMLRARAVVSNKNGSLLSGMFGKSKIHLSEMTKGLGVPINAIHQLSENHYVFIKEEEDLYSARRVQIGPQIGKHMLVTAGLQSNEEVVFNGSHIVYSEMFKSKLGAGCVDD